LVSCKYTIYFVIKITVKEKTFIILIVMNINIDKKLDCKGLSCPMPMLKLAKTMKGMKSGEILEMLGTDPGTKSDIPNWCEKTGNLLLEQNDLEAGVNRFVLEKK
jgi:tRNA 2-thiouridine synthesizing protein A